MAGKLVVASKDYNSDSREVIRKPYNLKHPMIGVCDAFLYSGL